MLIPKLTARVNLLAALLFALLLVAPASGAAVATVSQDDDARREAFQLFNDGKTAEALPAFEKLAAIYPKDPQVIETYGFLVLSQNSYLKDPADRKRARLQARGLLLRAQQLGANSALLTSVIEALPSDGGDDTSFSGSKEVDEAMREAEGAFMRSDFKKAIEMYQRALLFDPKLYEAALFIGDSYFSSADQPNAVQWFARAASIDPDRETAYRYWGDALMKQGKLTEAGEKFIEAYIAEPYNRLARAAFLNWGEKGHLTMAHPNVELPANVNRKETGTTITLDPNLLKKDDKSGSSAAWLMYGLVRAGWSSSEFAKNYPKEQNYRHSLKEEAAALRGALKALNNQKVDASKIDPSLQIIRKLEREGLLEAFILLALPDDGIANDFPDYRRTHAAELRRYVKQYVLTGGGN